MTEIQIKHLGTERRFSDGSYNNFYLLLYLPVGLIILFFRLILGCVIIVFGNVLPDVALTKNVLSQLLRAFLGIVIHVENLPNKEEVQVIVSNCITPLDHFVAHIATGCLMPEKYNLPSQLLYSLGVKNFGPALSLEDLKKSVGAFILNNTVPVLFQPELKQTNGKAILKFEEWPFSFTSRVQPVYLQVRRPIFDISITTITSSYWNDIFWYLFSPWTVYNLCFLPVEDRGELNDEEFAEKVRRKIATELRVEASSFNATDVVEWEKRFLHERRRARMVYNSASNTMQNNNPELHQMARQVKEVLPSVPYNVIFKDLVRTKNVDVTISNILEGHILYTPESTTPRTITPVSSTTCAPVAGTSFSPAVKDSLCTAASTFPKSAQQRMQSFQERKLQLIAHARKRYIEKHGLNTLPSNDC